MNWRHLQAFVWLRWRLLYNQWRRAGAFNAVLMMIVTFVALVTVIPLFIASVMFGLYAIPKAAPAHLMYAWDVLIVAFVFFWSIGLVTELQRTEPLSLSKFLHLPVSVTGAFLINYFSSLLRLSVIIFVPIMLGFCLALVWTKGTLLLLVLPSLAAFLVMVTALSYQLQGWLASLMSNPRRRRTVVVVTTITFVLIVQLPNLINFLAPWNMGETVSRSERDLKFSEEIAKLARAAESREIDAKEFVRRNQEIQQKYKLASQQAESATEERWKEMARLANLVLPLGWLPLSVAAAAEGRVMPSILGLLGMALIGAASLWRAYRTTVGMYQGQSTQRQIRPAFPDAGRARASKPGVLLLEARIPGLSEPVSAIALGALRSLLRSPEAKLMLLTPLIMIPIFGSMLWRGRHDIPEAVRPLIAITGMVFVLFGLLPLMGNQFGFDRDGFRVFVLCAASRRDILLGKNLAFVSIALVLALIVLAIVQTVCAMRLDHFLAMLPLFSSMYLLFCIFTNLLSILTPLHIAAGSLKASNPNIKTVLLQLVMFLFLFPLSQTPALLPLGIETATLFLGYGEGMPICLMLSLAELALVVVLYYFSLCLLGDLLQAREQNILECVTKGAT